MTITMSDLAERRCDDVRTKLRRHKLVWLQMGATFEPFREHISEHVAGRHLTAVEFLSLDPDNLPELGTVLLSEFEALTSVDLVNDVSLGNLRIQVDRCLDAAVDICLLSRAPRCSYPTVPGSSLLEDAAMHLVPCLSGEELLSLGLSGDALNTLPSCLSGHFDSIESVFEAALRELGGVVLAALDHAVFETGARNDFGEHLDVREREALRAAGLLCLRDDGSTEFVLPRRLSVFQGKLADVLAEMTDPQLDLADVSEGLWYIERTIRRVVRSHAITAYGFGWKKQFLHGDLASKVLDRARGDTAVIAASVSEVRDPLEWLSLGELLELIRVSNVGDMAADATRWRKFAEEVVPIRNRLSHMRLIRKGDREKVAVWKSYVKRAYGKK